MDGELKCCRKCPGNSRYGVGEIVLILLVGFSMMYMLENQMRGNCDMVRVAGDLLYRESAGCDAGGGDPRTYP